MNKTYNINLSGYAFVIDEDAYDMLDSYLKTLGQVCDRAGQRETAIDIEQRIAEIFTENATAIISRTQVEHIIDRMGSPEEIVEVADVAPDGSAAVPPPLPFGAIPIRKRLYRDVYNKLLGGVCSGLAWYLGIDVVWVRLIMVALAFLSGSVMIPIYIVLWIVVPPANTPFERMQMMGINPSVSNVGKVVTGAFDQYQATDEGSMRSSAGNFGRVVIMILSVVGLLVSGALLLVFSLAFIGCLIAVCVVPGGYNGVHTIPLGAVELILGCVIGGSLVAGVPLLLVFRWLMSVLTERKYASFTPQQRIFLAVPWALGLAACIACGILLGVIY